MPRSRPDGRCKKHPKHKQSPGVCSICLSEKLFQLSNSCSSRTTSSSTAMDSVSSSSSLSSYSSSSCSSSSSSPVHRYRYGVQGKGSLSFLLSGKNVLTKSRSLVFVPRTRGNKDRASDDNNKKKKGGFLSKLLRPKNKRIEEGLVHSRTMRG
ncbi:hypothetical protein P3X46_028733 [Hevea brasiliensis]|uniref:Uncharacterized protein n=1 Tax=Hevea brasiliensis TaxID=3981 RepID=A0ABQ9KRD8_HEVBR|nr:uncharacterized protein LOC110662858 [Hevea brasiliensis]KAJ9146474.1 hypothetical protein P3X46_028733 [Hevea brasiliensis]